MFLFQFIKDFNFFPRLSQNFYFKPINLGSVYFTRFNNFMTTSHKVVPTIPTRFCYIRAFEFLTLHTVIVSINYSPAFVINMVCSSLSITSAATHISIYNIIFTTCAQLSLYIHNYSSWCIFQGSCLKQVGSRPHRITGSIIFKKIISTQLTEFWLTGSNAGIFIWFKVLYSNSNSNYGATTILWPVID